MFVQNKSKGHCVGQTIKPWTARKRERLDKRFPSVFTALQRNGVVGSQCFRCNALLGHLTAGGTSCWQYFDANIRGYCREELGEKQRTAVGRETFCVATGDYPTIKKIGCLVYRLCF